MRVLVLNSGSSSLKYQLIETGVEQIASDTDRMLAHGAVERIGSQDAKITFAAGDGPKEEKTAPVLQHQDAIQIAFDHLTGPGGPIRDRREIHAVGHRFVHGGELFQQSTLIDDAVLRQIESVSSLAPLHNPHNLKGYYASKKLLPDVPEVAVFDTAFHHTLPPRAYLYGIPYEFYTRDKVRKYGFHGTSYRYISWRFAKLHGSTRDQLKLIACHLGNGCSICAIDHGRSIDTSMGFTPMDGLLMGTRCGEIDPGAVLYLAGRDGMGSRGVDVMLNTQSGLAGLTGGVSDMRDLLEKRSHGDERARDAIDIFCYRIVQFIGAYMTVLGGADAILFAGGIGENAPEIREQVCQGLGWLGVQLDADRNQTRGKNERITGDGSRVPVWVIPTDEELLIARDTFRCIEKIPHP